MIKILYGEQFKSSAPMTSFQKTYLFILGIVHFQISFAQTVSFGEVNYTLNQIVSQIPINRAYDFSGIIRISADELITPEKYGWSNIENVTVGGATSLALQVRRDTSVIKTDAEGRRYFQTFIRFGFTDDVEAYQLPGSYFIQERQFTNINVMQDDKMMNVYDPCLMFNDETFYIFIPNYSGNNNLQATLYTCSSGSGLIKELLWKTPVNQTGRLPYFKQDENAGFALIQSNELNYTEFTTTAENNKWVTRITGLKVSASTLEKKFKVQQMPLFLPVKSVPFSPVHITEPSFNSLGDLSVFMNTAKDREIFENISRLPVAADFTKIPMEDWGKYKIHFKDKELNKTRIFYNPISHQTFVVPNMPLTKSQDPFQSCASYSFGALYAQWINSDWQLKALRKIIPNALYKETDISYFGMQQYVRGNKTWIDSSNLWKYSKALQAEVAAEGNSQSPEFDFEYLRTYSFYYPYEIILQNENRLDSIPFFVDKYYFDKDGNTGEIVNGKLFGNDDKFRNDLLRMYNTNHGIVSPNNLYHRETALLSTITGIPLKNINLNNAFHQPNFQAFLYAVLFGSCNQYLTVAYRNNLAEERFPDKTSMKERIVQLVQKGKAIRIILSTHPNHKESPNHSLLICGYQKMKNPVTGRVVDAFKLHNSWGRAWDIQTNGGWFVADNIVSAFDDSILVIWYLPGDKALAKEWLENTPEYQQAYKGEYSSLLVKMNSGGYLGSANGINQTDAAPLLTIFKNEKLSYRQFADLVKIFFTNLGYPFKGENEKDKEIDFDGFAILYNVNVRRIEIATKEKLALLKAKLDFSKIQGEFEERTYSGDDGYYIQLRRE